MRVRTGPLATAVDRRTTMFASTPSVQDSIYPLGYQVAAIWETRHNFLLHLDKAHVSLIFRFWRSRGLRVADGFLGSAAA